MASVADLPQVLGRDVCTVKVAPCTVGKLRHTAVLASKGECLAVWDDDDVSHPLRLARQLPPVQRGDASALARVTLYRASTREVHISQKRIWEQTLVVTREAYDRVGGYPDLQHGEDTALVQGLRGAALLDAPELYIYNLHSGGTMATSPNLPDAHSFFMSRGTPASEPYAYAVRKRLEGLA